MQKQKELHTIVQKINTIFLGKFPDAILLDYGVPSTHPRTQTVFLVTLKYVFEGGTEQSSVEQFSYYLIDITSDTIVHLEDFVSKRPEVSMLKNFVTFENGSNEVTYRWKNGDLNTLEKQ